MKKVLRQILVLALITGSVTGLKAQRRGPDGGKPEAKAGLKVGDIAPDFKLKNVDGKKLSLKGMKKAKGYIVVFYSNVCPFAVLYQDRLVELHQKMAPRGYPVVAINSNDPTLQEGDSYENMQALAKEKGFPFPYVQDVGGKVFPQYGATKTPHVYLLDQDLKVQYIGAIDDNARSAEAVEERYVENAIAALEAGHSPDPNFTKAIGCGIKVKRPGGDASGGRPPRGDGQGPPSAEKLMEMMDQNKDGKISTSEAQGPLKNDFSRVDQNGDGFLTSEELSNLKPPQRGERR